MATFEGIRAAMRRYSVRKHYLASSLSSATKYAVFVDGTALTEPSSHAEADKAREQMVIYEIQSLFQVSPTTGESE